jgi:hypothetical protein
MSGEAGIGVGSLPEIDTSAMFVMSNSWSVSYSGLIVGRLG